MTFEPVTVYLGDTELDYLDYLVAQDDARRRQAGVAPIQDRALVRSIALAYLLYEARMGAQQGARPKRGR